MEKTSTIVLLGGKIVRFERWIPQGNRGPRHALSIARNSDNTFTCTAPSIGPFGGTAQDRDLAVALHRIGIDLRFTLVLVSLFEATGLTRASVAHEFPEYEVQSDEDANGPGQRQLTLGF